jgi:hypothetical protein
MATSRRGADILQLQPQFHKVPLRVAEGESLGANTLVGVRAADGLAEQAQEGGDYTRVFVAYLEFDSPETGEGWAKYETVDNAILRLRQDGTIDQTSIGETATLVDHQTVALGGTGAEVGEIVEFVSEDWVRVHVK